eukprot:2207588-Pyramimonas_sp.AAC.1
MVECREGAPEALETKETLLDPPSFGHIVGSGGWGKYLSATQSFARAVPLDSGCADGLNLVLDKAEWLEAAQDALGLIQQYVLKLQWEAHRE